VSRRDGKARMPWSVKGVSPEARDLAKTVTTREGDTMGEWLSDVIRRVGAAQAAGRQVSAPAQRRGLPVLTGRRPVGGDSHHAIRPGYPTVAAPSAPPSAPPADATAQTVDEAALAMLIAERVERSEARMVGLMQSLEDIVTRLADRLERLEQSLDDGDRDDQRSLPRS